MVGVTARDVMSREFVGVSEGDAVDEVLELMVDQAVDDVLVLRGSEPVGVVTSQDLLGAVADGRTLDAEPVEEYMDAPPTPVTADEDVDTLLARLSGARADTLPVESDEDGLVGVVTDADVIAAAASLVTEPNGVDSTASGDALSSADQLGVDAASRPNATPATTSASGEHVAEHATQGVCESCSTLTGDLQVVNGQSICPECRDV